MSLGFTESADMREKLAPFYSEIGRPSIDPELMVRMLIVGYCYGIRFERRLYEKVVVVLVASAVNSEHGFRRDSDIAPAE
jgi:transposase